MSAFECPEARYHGNPFRYCPVKGCGWMEEQEPAVDAELAVERANVVSLVAEVTDLRRLALAREILSSYDGNSWYWRSVEA